MNIDVNPHTNISKLNKWIKQNLALAIAILVSFFKRIVGVGVKKIHSLHIPDLTDKEDHAPIKNMLLVFMMFAFVFFSGSTYLYGEKVMSDIDKLNTAKKTSALEMNIRRMVKGSPISRMVPYISRQDEKTAMFLVAIAKKESNWGKYAPKKGKKECYNYWGYRGTYNQTASGYSCFDSGEQAVRVVGKRIRELAGQGINTPEEMIVWKCGGSCDGHSPGSVQKWIKDVSYYYHKINS
jgi:hypothetical protein